MCLERRDDKVDDTHKINNMTVNPLEPRNALLCATVKYPNDENAYCMF